MLENLNAILSRSQPSVKNFQCHDTRISIDSSNSEWSPSHSAGYLKFNWNYHAVWNLSDSMAFDWRHVFSLIILDQSFRNFMVNFEPCFFFSIFFPLAFFFRFLKLYEHPTGRLFDLNWFSINQKKKRKEKKKKEMRCASFVEGMAIWRLEKPKLFYDARSSWFIPFELRAAMEDVACLVVIFRPTLAGFLS